MINKIKKIKAQITRKLFFTVLKKNFIEYKIPNFLKNDYGNYTPYVLIISYSYIYPLTSKKQYVLFNIEVKKIEIQKGGDKRK